jgi:hypothetical protein
MKKKLRKTIIMVFLACLPVLPGYAAEQNEEEKNVYKTQVPPGLERQRVGNKDAYRVVLPKGTLIRREADIRIIEGTGEYAARRFLEYDARLEKMSADIELLRKEIVQMRKEIAESKSGTLVSK